MTLEERAAILYAAQNDPKYREEFNAAVAADCVFFINTCLWIFHPPAAAGRQEIPYLLRPFQEELVRESVKAIDEGYDILNDKSREMGVSWAKIGVGGYKWVFERTFTGTFSSITEDKIDSKNDEDTLFWKFDYLIESLKIDVPWLYPPGYKPVQPFKKHMMRHNPHTRATIKGEVMGPNLGRQGRRKFMLLDEFAEAAAPASSWAASSRTCPSRHVVFTPHGMNFAGRLANPDRGKAATIKKHTLHWIIDPEKNLYFLSSDAGEVVHTGHGIPPDEETGGLLAIGPGLPPPRRVPSGLRLDYPWYTEACGKLNNDPVKVAQELDVDYNESVEGLMYPQIERAKVGKVPFSESLKLYCSMDYGVGDMTALLWWQWDPAAKRFHIIDAYQNRGHRMVWFIPFITGKDLGLGESEGGYSDYDLEIVKRHEAYWGRYTDFYGDPAGKQRNMVSNTSVIQELSDYDIHVRTNDKARGFGARKEALARILPFCDIDEENCSDFIQAIRDSRENRGIPVHGPESHFRSSGEYFAVNVPHAVVGGGNAEEDADDMLNRYGVRPEDREMMKRLLSGDMGGAAAGARTRAGY